MSRNGKAAPTGAAETRTVRRPYVSQTDVPACTLDEALRIPVAIAEHYAYQPSTPLSVAAAMQMQPSSGSFRELTGAAAAYGLTDGGAFADQIAISPLGMRAVRPLREGDDVLACREALLRPRVVGAFLRKYDNAPLPRVDIALNVLVELGVPRERAEKVHEFILAGAESVGFLRVINDRRYVDLAGTSSAEGAEAPDFGPLPVSSPQNDRSALPALPDDVVGGMAVSETNQVSTNQLRRVFITHGKNRALLDPIKKLLSFGELDAVVSVETVSVSQPVPDKVMGEMRSCGAAIIHVDAERTLLDNEAKEHVVLNPNVLIEIGAAQALFGRRLILLVRDGVALPSNVQGLFEVRYKGDTLDGDATIRLLEAINDIKNHPMPNRYSVTPDEPRA